MGLRINTNVPSTQAQNSLEQTTSSQEKTLSRLSSGQRITNAGDDAAGLAIGSKLNAQVRGMVQAKRSANDGISLVQTAEGGANEVSNMLVRLRELSVQAASDTVGHEERQLINIEATELKGEIDRIAASTTFNGVKLLNGENSQSELQFQVGANGGEENRIKFDVNKMNVTSGAIGVSGLDLSERDSAAEGLTVIDEALQKVNANRASLGATQNRLTSTNANLSNMITQFSNAKSQIMDADYAKETADMVRANILANSGVSVLSQANNRPAQALKLL